MDRVLGASSHYASRQTTQQNKSLEFHRDFRITHYAGDVTYDVTNFIDKNRDTLYQDFKRLIYNRCTVHLLYRLFVLVCSQNAHIGSLFPEGARSAAEVNKRPLTAGTRFKQSMIALVENLASKVSCLE